jgi:hypothetical protein
MNLKFFWILPIYTIWDRLSQKPISRYCPFNVALTGLLVYCSFASQHITFAVKEKQS